MPDFTSKQFYRKVFFRHGLLGGHIDSWDVGQGAQDDGSGMIASLQAVALIKKLGLQPRRTIRVAFWVNEENGGRGLRAVVRGGRRRCDAAGKSRHVTSKEQRPS